MQLTSHLDATPLAVAGTSRFSPGKIEAPNSHDDGRSSVEGNIHAFLTGLAVLRRSRTFIQQCIDAIIVCQILQRCQPIDIPTTHPFIVRGVIFILSWEELWRERQKGARG